MSKLLTQTAAGIKYAEAYAAHYQIKDFYKAMILYGDLVSTYPNSPEADFARSQVRNIAEIVVPKQKLLASQLALALSHLESMNSSNILQ